MGGRSGKGRRKLSQWFGRTLVSGGRMCSWIGVKGDFERDVGCGWD